MRECGSLREEASSPKLNTGQDVGVPGYCEGQRWKHGGMFLDCDEVIVRCSHHGVQSGQVSEKDVRLGVFLWALKTLEGGGAPRTPREC